MQPTIKKKMNNAFDTKTIKKKHEQNFKKEIKKKMENALRRQEAPRELEHKREAKHMLAPQSEANVCQHKCSLKKSRLLIAQDTQQKLGVAFSYLKRN